MIFGMMVFAFSIGLLLGFSITAILDDMPLSREGLRLYRQKRALKKFKQLRDLKKDIDNQLEKLVE